ncbi:preprotein translocase subunit YajC [Oikeobacillus pervagus]|uniref:Preprotein translocase subunit YajC n=1 Tax=Oikeobacillus pervagus TaxID=1325931 RepID=A0AAJ1T2A5_9BACI|nr:hypothetical protein [Oikeobacillus pervagus]MDQ0213966.1 preprotein translocase subunit YajC [Oikeobacillus pervagus]
MKNHQLKGVILIILSLILIIMMFFMPRSSFTAVKIVEKYFSEEGKSSLQGVSTNKKVEITNPSDKQICAMEFSNGKILEVDCDLYLNYSIGEKVKIKYKRKKIISISKK